MNTNQSIDLSEYTAGSTEPWTAQVVAVLAAAIGAQYIVETGTFEGKTTQMLHIHNPQANITTVELDRDRYEALVPLPGVNYINDDALAYLTKRIEPIDFIFIDDNHEFPHVAAEVRAAKRLLTRGGIICLHDVDGPFQLDLATPRGGINLHFRKIHVAGGLGIWQKP